jgi:flagellin
VPTSIGTNARAQACVGRCVLVVTGLLFLSLEYFVPQIINTNLSSLNSQRHLNSSQNALSTSMQRLSSGMRVNSAKDDAAGLQIATRMDARVRGMNVAIRNANDGVSFVQTAEGALGKVTDMLQRMRELAVQAANGTNSAADRTSSNQEYLQLASEASRTLAGTTFNGQAILEAATTVANAFQVGAGTSSNLDRINVAAFSWISNSNITNAIGAAVTTPPVTQIAGTNGSAATSAINNLDLAIDAINSQRATYGAVQNRFESAISVLQISVENQTAARSRIMDADYAAETSAMSRANILQQAGNAMVAQANQGPQGVLSLLR